MLVDLKQPFTYWHDGYEAKTYGPGEADVPPEVAEAAAACGALAPAHSGGEEAAETRGRKGRGE